jgi:hypothetical protein
VTITRRTILWTAPVVTLVAAAPAYATSANPTPDLDPVACRRPGVGKHTKDYFLRTRHRDDVTILGVLIDGREAEPGPHGWETRFTDSRIERPVTVAYALTADLGEVLHWTGKVTFPVCKEMP